MKQKDETVFLSKLIMFCFFLLVDIVFASTLYIFHPGTGYRVDANGNTIGYVKLSPDIERMEKLIEQELKREHGEDITYELELDKEYGSILGKKILTEEEIKDNVKEEVELYGKAYIIKEEGVPKLVVKTKGVAQYVLDQTIEAYKQEEGFEGDKEGEEGEEEINFAHSVEIVEANYVPLEMILDKNQALGVVENPDVVTEVALQGDMGLRNRSLHTASRSALGRRKAPLFDIESVGKETLKEEVPFSQKKTYNDSLYIGTVRVKQEGKVGQKEITYKVIKLNNKVVEKEKVEEILLLEPQDKIVEYGTKTKLRPLVEIAKKYLGTPYVWGGSTPNGFDCSGFTQYVYRESGKKIPRTSGEQAKVGMEISRDQLSEGDLVCFPGHVGIYLGDGKFIHAPRRGSFVKIDNLDKRKDFLFGRRIQ